MEWEGKIFAPSWTCSVTNRALAPGEVFYSGLSLRAAPEEGFARTVFSAEAWTAQDHQPFLSWWRQQVPKDDGKDRRLKLDADSLHQLFSNLRESRTRTEQCLAYVIGLALIRAKRLTLRTVERTADASWLLVEDRKQGVAHRIRDPQMSVEEQQRVLTDLLTATGLG